MAVNMATAPRMPQTNTNEQYSQFFIQTQSKDATPSSSASDSPQASTPTSPRNLTNVPSHLAFQSRQLRPPKSPLYVPAVLRPTERPSHLARKSNSTSEVPRLRSTIAPLTPPASEPNSWEDKKHGFATDDDLDARIMLGDDIARTRITRIVTDEWNEDKLEPVTDLPTKNHWKPDASSPSCDATDCEITFSLLNRRHHCRRCGNIFCAPHSVYNVPLDQHARFHPQGASARACISCWADYSAWKKARKSRNGSIISSDSSNSSKTATAAPSEETPSSAPKTTGTSASDKPQPTFVLGSVPRDWNWSTF